MALSASANSLLSLVNDVISKKVERKGQSSVEVDGPGGMWRVQYSKSKKAGGGWMLRVTSPAILGGKEGTTYTTVGELGSALSSATEETPPLEEAVAATTAPLPPPPPGVEEVAATLLVGRVRAFLLRRTARRVEPLLQQERELRERIASLVSTVEARLDAFLAVDRRQVSMSASHPEVSLRPPPVSDRMDSVPHPLPTSLMEIASNDFSLTRDALREAAATISVSEQSSELARVCALSLLREPHFFLLVAALPLPSQSFTFPIPSGEVVVVPTPGDLSSHHSASLAKHFPEGWTTRCRQAARDRPVGVLDVFRDRRRRAYVGSLLLSKHVARSKGRFLPVVGIESIVVDVPHKGGGNVLFAIAKELLFTDAQHVESGIIFAQCVPHPFWTDLLDISSTARSLVLQMVHLYSRYGFETECQLRSRVFYKDDDLDSVHCKKIPRISR